MRVHFISFGKEVDFLGYLSIVSAIHTQKASDFYLWYLSEERFYEGKNYWDSLPSRIKKRKFEIDFIPGIFSVEEFAQLPLNRGVPIFQVFFRLKDIAEWKVLAEYGGLFLDLDTLSISDISDHMPQEDKIRVWEHYGFIGNQRVSGFYNNAVIMVPENSISAEIVLREALKKLNVNSERFDELGPQFLSSIVNERPEIFEVDTEVCEVDGIDDGRVRNILSAEGYVWEGAKILHLHRQSVTKGVEITQELIEKTNSPFARLARQFLSSSYFDFLPERRRKKRFHILGLQHLATNKKNLSCAYTQKALKLCKMLKMLDHQVFFYGVETSEVEADEFVQVLSLEELEKYVGKHVNEDQFYNLEITEAHNIFDRRAIEEINKRKQEDDFLLCPYGWGHKRIADGVGLPLTVESGIGYRDTFAPFRVFESYCWMHFVYGFSNQDDGKNYDVVIPNYFDPLDFEYSERKGDFLLYLGRIIFRKGLEIAIQAAEATQNVIYVAGQYCGEDVNLARPRVVYLGYVDVEKRRSLLRDAKALLVPTVYIGPFEGVHVEAWFSGTPVITSDWGVFGETVLHGVTGYRCRTFDHYCWAIQNIERLSPRACYEFAMANFSLEKVAKMYEEYFDMIYDLVHGSGWYESHPERVRMEWLKKYYPREATI